MNTFGLLLAVEEGTKIDPTGGLLSYGVLGIVVTALITGILVPGYLYKRTEGENDRLRKLIDDKVYPAIEASAQATRESAIAMRESQETMREVIQVLADANAMNGTPVRPRPRKRV